MASRPEKRIEHEEPDFAVDAAQHIVNAALELGAAERLVTKMLREAENNSHNGGAQERVIRIEGLRDSLSMAARGLVQGAAQLEALTLHEDKSR